MQSKVQYLSRISAARCRLCEHLFESSGLTAALATLAHARLEEGLHSHLQRVVTYHASATVHNISCGLGTAGGVVVGSAGD